MMFRSEQEREAYKYHLAYMNEAVKIAWCMEQATNLENSFLSARASVKSRIDGVEQQMHNVRCTNTDDAFRDGACSHIGVCFAIAAVAWMLIWPDGLSDCFGVHVFLVCATTVIFACMMGTQASDEKEEKKKAALRGLAKQKSDLIAEMARIDRGVARATSAVANVEANMKAFYSKPVLSAPMEYREAAAVYCALRSGRCIALFGPGGAIAEVARDRSLLHVASNVSAVNNTVGKLIDGMRAQGWRPPSGACTSAAGVPCLGLLPPSSCGSGAVDMDDYAKAMSEVERLARSAAAFIDRNYRREFALPGVAAQKPGRYIRA